jgi:hypothetical protein
MSLATQKQAFEEYFKRAKGDEFPDGEYGDDDSFHPSALEMCIACPGFEADPSVTPEMLYAHCLSPQHIALRYDLDPDLFVASIGVVLGITQEEDAERRIELAAEQFNLEGGL